MANTMPRNGGRPRGEFRLLIKAAVETGGPGTTREIQQRAGTGKRATQVTVDNLCRAGELCVVARVRVPGVKQSVPVYGVRPEESAPARLESVWGASPAAVAST